MLGNHAASTNTAPVYPRFSQLSSKVSNVPSQQQDQRDNDEEEENEEDFEEVPDEMTAAVLDEEANVRRALMASRASAEEDEVMRAVLEKSSEEMDLD